MIRSPLKTLALALGLVGLIYAALPSSTTPEPTTAPTPASESSVQPPSDEPIISQRDADQLLDQLGFDKSERNKTEAALAQGPTKKQITQWEQEWEAFLSTDDQALRGTFGH
jgi:hypothetical protein